MKKVIILFVLTLLSAAQIQAQKDQKKLTVLTGKVMDSEYAEALQSCNVMVMKPDTTSMVTGNVTKNNGSFEIKNMKPGNYVLKVSYIGYHNFFRAFTIQEGQEKMNLGTMIMVPNSVMLESAVVKGQLPEVEVKDDTLIFNADAFKVPEGSVLEELIKKLPGAEVDDNGKITINGKTVKKILVEGKEFFSSETSMAMKNLPTEIIEKVKTYDKQSDMARITGIDDGNEETVIDLTIKKGMKNGWFGNVDVGVGTEERYANRGMLNRFQDDLQASLIANYGNGGRGGGNTTSGQAGLNLNLDLDELELGGNVRYGGSETDSWRRSSTENFISTNASFSNNYNKSLSHNKNAGGDLKLEWAPDSVSRLLFRPNFSFGDSDSESKGISATFNDDPYEEGIDNPLEQIEMITKSKRVNKNQSSSLSDNNNLSFNGSLLYNRRLSNKGRNFSINLSGNYSKNESKSYNMSDVIYYQRNDSTSLTYRYRTTPNENKSFSAGLTYSEPIMNNVHLQLNYRYNYSKRHSDGNTFDLGHLENMRDSLYMYGVGFLPFNYENYLDSELSRYTDNENHIHNIDLQLRIITSAMNMNIGVAMEPQKQKVDYNYQGLDTVASRNFFHISPTLNFRYRFSSQNTLNIRYRGNTSQPEITDMFNMTDTSNPLNIREGNPGLKPSFTNNLNIDYNYYDIDTRRNIVAGLTFRNTLNSISNRTEYYEETGGRRTRPENINGNWNIGLNFGYTTPLFTDKLNVTSNTSSTFNNNVGYIYQNQETLKNKVKNLNLNERISLRWREEYWDLSANASVRYNSSRSKLLSANNRDTYDFNYGLAGNANFENGLGFSTDLGMSSRRGYSSADMNTNEFIWNAQISYRFLEGRKATVTLQAFDLLSQRSNISRTINATMRSDSETNTIYSYVMLRFTYRFGSFGGRRMRGSENMGGNRSEMNSGSRGGGMSGSRGGMGRGGR